MKLSTLLLITSILQVSASSFAQKITLSETNVPLVKIFKQIRTQTGYDFMFSNSTLSGAKNVTIKVQNAELSDVLKKIFENQPLDYSMEAQSVVISKKASSFFTNLVAILNAVDISGRVLDTDGRPISGATVNIKGTRKTAITNESGFFKLANVNEDAILSISYIGYQNVELSAKADLSKITLKLSDSKLDEVQVIAYGTSSKRLNTGNVTSVKAGDIEKQPVNNPLLALQGRVPGAFITQTNGLPGSNIVVRIRGQNTFNQGNSNPLYIVDGVPFEGSPMELQGGGGVFSSGATGYTNPLIMINPADIESIEVLKDADATAIYGSRAANGVILVTTKKAKTGKTVIDAGFSSSVAKIAHRLDLLNLDQYLTLRNQAFTNDNITATAANAPDLKTWDTTKETDFQDLLLGNTAKTTNGNLSISGGNANTRMLIRGNYNRETTVLPGDDANIRGTFHANADHTSTDGKLNAGVTFTYSKSVSTIGAIDPTEMALTLPPNFPLYKDDGEYTLFYNSGTTSRLNPLASLENLHKTNTENILLNFTLQYQLFKGLKFKTNAGMTKSVFDQKDYIYRSSFDFSTASSTVLSNVNENYIVEPMFEFNKIAGLGKLNIILGGTWQNRRYKQPYYINASGIPTDNLIENYLAAATVSVKGTGSEYQYKYASVFGRLNYNIDGKYIFNGSLRRDASSRFGENKQFGNFGSVGGAWILTEEDFIKKMNAKWLSFAKLRASYGVTGNDQASDYEYLASYTTTAYTYGGTSLYPSRIANPDYSWELTRKLEVSAEVGFFNNQLLATGTWFRNRSGNMLVNYAISQQTGFSTYVANLDAMVQNKGWEFELSSTNIKNKNFSWTSGFNLTIPENKLLKFPNLESSSYASAYIIGESLNILRGYHYTGMVNGVPTVQDVNNSGTYTSGLAVKGNGDYVVMGKTTPDYYGGLSNGFTYKNWSLDILFMFAKQKALDVRSSLYMPGLPTNLDVKSIEDGFKPTQLASGTAVTAYARYKLSDALVDDASYIRLKNMSLSYNFNAAWLKRIKLDKVRVYLQGQNLLTFTSFNGMDPESGALSIPPLKILMTGLQITF